jgi:replicative DNA helicase
LAGGILAGAKDTGQLQHNLDAEQAVLAAMILDKEIVEEAVLAIRLEDFFKPAHQMIFTAMLELVNQHIPVDQLTLADKLDAQGNLSTIGGKEYILTLADKSYALSNWASHAEIVKNDSLLRALINAAVHIKALSESSTDDADMVVEEAEKLLFEATNKRISSSFQSLSALYIDAMELLDAQSHQKKNIMLGVPTGFRELDDLFVGMRPGDLLVLAARPGVGKTALALNIAANAARSGAQVAFFSLEMPAQQLVQRMLSAEAGIDSHKMRTGRLSQADFQEIARVGNELDKFKFDIDDSPGLSILELRAKARRQLHHDKANGGLIVVDYLQLMEPPRSNRQRDRHLEVGEISRGLKILAKEIGVPILALSQLSRVVEGRRDKRPQLSDLRESGSIEQDADVVMFIDRSLSAEEALNQQRPDLGIANLIVGKNRNGATRDIEMVFIPEHTTFKDKYRMN